MLYNCCCSQQDQETARPCAAGCPEPISPATQNRWLAQAAAYDIYATSGGTGMLTLGDPDIGAGPFPDQALDCMAGNCGAIRYRRKKVFVQDWYAGDGVCANQYMIDAACAALDQGESYSMSGSSSIEWTGCTGFVLDGDNPSSNVTNDTQSGDGVEIKAMDVDQLWYLNTATGVRDFRPVTNSDENPDCLAVIRVEYSYYDAFNAPYFHNVNDDCQQDSIPVGVASSWTCWYARRETASSKIPTGRYKLMKVAWSGPLSTYDANMNVCTWPYSNVATRATYDDVGTIKCAGDSWTPTQFITVTRLA